MAVSFIEAVLGSANPTTSFTVGTGTNTLAGDDLYLTITSRDHAAGTALPSVTDDDTGGNTWTLIGNSTDRKALLYWKKATSGTASKTVTVSGCVGSSAGVLKVFRGAAAGNPTEGFVVETNASGDETLASFTPATADSMLCVSIHNYANDNNVTSLTSVNHGALTTSERVSTGGSDCGVAFGHDLMTGSTATGNITWAQTNGTTYGLTWSIKPGPASQSTTPGLITQTPQLFSPSFVQTQPVAAGLIRAARYRDFMVSYAPTLYWRLGESSGTLAVDEIGTLDGTYQNTPTLGVSGLLTNDSDKAVQLDGTELVTVPDGPTFVFESPFTLGAWVKHSGTFGSFGDAIFGKGTLQPYLFVHPSGIIEFAKSDSHAILQSASAVVTDSVTTHFIVITFDGEWARLYVNGVENNQNDGAESFPFADGASDFAIGSKWPGVSATDGWHGVIDEPFYCERVLTPTEVKLLYDVGVSSAPTFPYAPVVDLGAAPGAGPRPPLIQQLGTVFAPTKLNLRVNPSRLEHLLTTITPTINQKVQPGLIQQLGAASAPQINLRLAVGQIASGHSIFAPNVAPKQFVTPGLISQLGTLFSPQVNLRIALGLIASGHNIFSPTVVGQQFITPGLIQQLGALFTPKVNLSLTPGLIASGHSIFSPTVIRQQFVTPGLVQQLGVLFNPQVNLRVSPGVIASGHSIFSPTIIRQQFVTPGLVQQLGTPFSPQVNLKVSPGLVQQLGVTFAPALRQFVTPGLIQQLGSTFEPRVNLSIALGLIPATNLIHAPTLIQQQFVTPPLITQAGAPFDPTVINRQLVSVDRIAQLGVTFDPFISTGQILVQPPVIENLGTTFQFSLTQQLFLTPAVIQQLAVAHSPTITAFKLVSPDAITQLGQPFAPSINQQVVAALIAQLGSVFAPQVNLNLQLGLIEQVGTLFDPTVHQQVRVDLISQLALAFAPTVTQEAEDNVVQPTFISQLATPLAPVIASQLDLDLDRIEALTQLFNPSVRQSVAAQLIPSGINVYAPDVTLAVDIPLIASTILVPSPTIIYAGQAVVPDLIPSNVQLFDFQTNQVVSFDLIDNSGVVFAFAIVYLGSRNWSTQPGFAGTKRRGWGTTQGGYSDTKKSGWPTTQKGTGSTNTDEG